MALSVYLNFPGNATEVIEYYKSVFNTPEPEITYFKDMPPSDEFPVTPEMENMVMHASIQIDDAVIMFSDTPPGSPQPLVMGNNISVMFSDDDFDKLKKYFDKLAGEGNVIMPYGKTFWSTGFGMLADKYGIIWQFNCNDEG